MTTETATAGAIVAVPINQILDNPYQYRGHYDAEHILKLAASIQSYKNELRATQGLQQVPMARLVFLDGRSGGIKIATRSWYEGNRAAQTLADDPTAKVQLMFGHSRLRAFEVLREGLRSLLKYGGNGLGFDLNALPQIETDYAALLAPDLDYATMPMLLSFADDPSMWSHAITENSQRKNVTPIDEAKSLQRAMDEFGFTTEQAAKPFGWARSTAANKLRLLELPDDVQKQIAAGDLTERHGRELLRVAADPNRVRTLAEKTVKGKLNVRQLEESVKWEEKGLKEEQQKAAEAAAAAVALEVGYCLPGQSAGIPTTALSDLPDFRLHEFRRTETRHQALIERGICGPHCACFVIGYSPNRSQEGYCPDPQGAPHFCAACSDYNARNEKDKMLGALQAADRTKVEAELAERKRQVEALNNQAYTLWQSWLRDQDKHALWYDIRFWRAVNKRVRWKLEDIFTKAKDAPNACHALLVEMYQATSSYNYDYGAAVHTLEEVRKLIADLDGRVSQETPSGEVTTNVA